MNNGHSEEILVKTGSKRPPLLRSQELRDAAISKSRVLSDNEIEKTMAEIQLMIMKLAEDAAEDRKTTKWIMCEIADITKINGEIQKSVEDLQQILDDVVSERSIIHDQNWKPFTEDQWMKVEGEYVSDSESLEDTEEYNKENELGSASNPIELN